MDYRVYISHSWGQNVINHIDTNRTWDVRSNGGEGKPDAKHGLHNQRGETNNVNAGMMLRDVHCNLQEESRKRDAFTIAKVREHRKERNNRKNDGTS